MRALAVGSLLCLILLVASPAWAQKRVALVMGNDEYQELPRLKKAVNDARAVADTLSAIGFQVFKGENLDRRQTNRLVANFEVALQPGDQAFVFYAGHGVAIRGENVLLPVDMPKPGPSDEELVRDEGTITDNLVRRVQARGAAVAVFVIDACRDNPFAVAGTRTIGIARGLARVDAPRGMLLIHSASPGEAALDRLYDNDPDPNSVFTRQLLPLLKEQGLSHIAIAKQLQKEVHSLAATVHHTQLPDYVDRVIGEVVINPRRTVIAAPPGPAGSPTQPRLAIEASLPSPLPALPAPAANAPTIAVAAVSASPVLGPSSVPVPVQADRSEVVGSCDRQAAHPQDRDKPAAFEGVDQGRINPAAAIAACEAAVRAEPQNRRMLYQLGRAMAASGDYRQARDRYETAAGLGSSAAMRSLGFLYDAGHGVAKDPVQARRWYERAADSGDARAMYNLGVLHQQGSGLPQDYRIARQWYERAAALGEALAMHNLGVLYENGSGVGKDLTKARQWYEKAALLGNAAAKEHLASLPRARR